MSAFFRQVRAPAETWPVIGCVVGAFAICGYVGFRTLAIHNDITINKRSGAAYTREPLPLLASPEQRISWNEQLDKAVTGRR